MGITENVVKKQNGKWIDKYLNKNEWIKKRTEA